MLFDKQDVTQWIPPRSKPIRVGVYQRLYSGDEIYFCMWNGSVWIWRALSPEKAEADVTPSTTQWLPWRGLSTNPNKGA